MVLLNTTARSSNNSAFNLNVPKMDMHPCFKGYEAYMRDVEKDTACLFTNTPSASNDMVVDSTGTTPVIKDREYQ